MYKLIFNLIAVLGIAIAGLGFSVLWRTSIYTRGSIFRSWGRRIDYWIYAANLPNAGFGRKLLRFIAYPLGRCIYCSSFHITYDVFFIVNWKLNLGLDPWLLIFILPLSQLLVTIFAKHYINDNEDMERGDWDYMNSTEPKFYDWTRRYKELDS